MLEGQFPRIRLTADTDQTTFRGISEQFRLQESCYATDVVITTLRTYLDEVWKTCEKVSTTADPETVRRLRVTAKRTSVALSIFSPLLSKKLVASFKHSLRSLRKTAGATRDYDVLSERLQLHIPPESSSSSIQRSSLSQLLQLVAIKQTVNRASIMSVRSQLLLWGWQSRSDDITAPTQQNKKLYKAFIQHRLKKSCAQFSVIAKSHKKKPEQLHQLRIAGKNLRYALELLPKKDLSKPLETCQKILRKMQKKVGDFTDHTAAAEILKQFSKEPMADDILYVINTMQREENTLANISRHGFFDWWTKNRCRLMCKKLNKVFKND